VPAASKTPRRRRSTVRRLLDVPDRLRKRIDERRAAREFAGWFSDPARLSEYRDEIRAAGLVEELAPKRASYDERVRGETRGWRYVFGNLREEEAINLYALLRKTRPAVVVETGVCNGFSSAFILAALERNGAGRLHSVDLPEVAGVTPSGTFWKEKLGAAIPAGEQPGWIIPDRLRARWRLTLGRSQDVLPPLLAELGTIDCFFHDSEHSYECMSFEFGASWPALRDGGTLVADDFLWNDALPDFARAHARPMIRLSRRTAFVVR
jgi:predicted O-methyltransferase YrrM